MTTHTSTQPLRPIPHDRSRRVIEGFTLPDRSPPTDNELGWIEMLRVITGDADPPPSLPAVQALYRALMSK